MNIKVLWTGCPSCIKLEKNAKIALDELGVEYNLEKVTEIEDILSYGVMGTPALVVDGKVVSAGKVLNPKQITKLLG